MKVQTTQRSNNQEFKQMDYWTGDGPFLLSLKQAHPSDQGYLSQELLGR